MVLVNLGVFSQIKEIGLTCVGGWFILSKGGFKVVVWNTHLAEDAQTDKNLFNSPGD
jgi:hypothetical protein